jgi:oligo-alginate lyase
MKRLLIMFCLLVVFCIAQAQHPITFFTGAEVASIKKGLATYPLLKQSYEDIKKQVDAWVDKDVDVPVPKDPAGGYTHDRHRDNYLLMFNSGILYNLTGEEKYARLVKNILLKYATLNPGLKNHPQATSSSPGHIFWQALNDANWLVYTGMAYDCIYNSLSASDRKTIEEGAFKPEVDFITKDLQKWFDLVHNHGVWACAGVGIIGIATNNAAYVNMALKGTAGDGKSGFLAQMDNLFSPDGYYTEGPYYVRYALLPYYLFANALHHARPALNIFEYRQRILQKALMAGLQQTNIDGRFFPYNDAIKEKDWTSAELVIAVDIAYQAYGADKGLLTVAQKQNRVILNKSGVTVAAAIAHEKNIPAYFPYRSIEYTDGAKGNEGGISLLRNGSHANLTTLIYKYTAHGLSHGHFDKLTFSLYDKGNEIFTDYGSARFVNVEQKYGGRYLPENEAYAVQTIAHNTMVVDETSHFNANEKLSGQYHSEKLFSNHSHEVVQVVAARETHAYNNVSLQRTLYLLQLPGSNKMVVDIFNTTADAEHQYDLPFQFNGHLMGTSFKYQAFTNRQETMGEKNGYQYLWKEAEATVADTLIRFTFLNDRTFYSVSSLILDSARLFIARSGAHDPNFNIRHEPSFIIRKKGRAPAFINVIEIHGHVDPVSESTGNAYPSVQKINWLQNDAQYSVAMITMKGKPLLIAQCNQQFDAAAKHVFNKGPVQIEWTGPYTVLFDGRPLNP